MLPRLLVIAIAVIVTLAWAANVVVGFLDPTRSVPGLNLIFGIVVGSAFALPGGQVVARKVGQMLTGAPPPPDDPGSTP